MWLKNLINNFFLVKEIKEQDGTLHFLRWRIFAIPWLRLYLHKICLPDYDDHMHDHPWNFLSLILKGSYLEIYQKAPAFWSVYADTRGPLSLAHKWRKDIHKIQSMQGPVWTLVLAYGPHQTWGYRVKDGRGTAWIDHKTYRKNKRDGLLGNYR